MKKTLLTILCALTALFGMAQTEANYTEQYVVSLNGTAQTPQDGEEKVVANTDGTVNFTLKNFTFEAYGTPVSVGDLTLNNLSASIKEDGLVHFEGTSTFSIPVENLPANLKMLANYGVSFDNIPVEIKGKMNGEKLYALMNINMASARTQITVEVGTENFNSKVYTEMLVVTANGESAEPQEANVVVVENADGTVNFELKNFFLDGMPVGNIIVENLTVTKGSDGLDYIYYTGNIFILPGDQEGVDTWIGPMVSALNVDEEGNPLGIPIVLNGKMNDEKLFVTIDIDMKDTALGDVVYVQLGTDDFVLPAVKAYPAQPYYVTFKGVRSGRRAADIEVLENSDATINFTVKDLVLTAGEMVIPVGDLTLHALETEAGGNGRTSFSGERTIYVSVDKLPQEYQAMVSMSGLTEIPVGIVISGWYDDEKVYADIDASMQLMGDWQFQVQIGIARGDVNCDGTVDIADVVSVLNAMAGQTVDGDANVNGDYTETGEPVVDIADVVSVLNIMAGVK